MKYIAVVFAFTFLMASCGGGTEKPATPPGVKTPPSETPAPTTETTPTPTEETTPVAEEDAEPVAVTLELGGTDAMEYTKKQLKVPAGSEVTLILTHTGKMTKEAMGHNFVLLKQGTSIPKFGAAAVAFKDNGYIPDNTSEIIAHTKMLGGGESDTIVFKAPAKGSYDYICSFPGHYAMMKGKFIVE